jgi:hypothetical protein
MKGLCWAVGLAFVAAVSGCGSDQNSAAATLMPDVVGLQLDVALSDIQRAGIEAEVEVLGGGAFGVVDESNWKVCEQLPAAGDAVATSPRLTVDRSCEGDDAESTTSLGNVEPAATEPPAAEPAITEPTAATIQEVDEAGSTEPDTGGPLTVENSPDLAALLAGPDCGDDAIARFAIEYAGRTITFDGHISNMQNHGDYDTRYDILLNTGDFSETTLAGIQNGPSFKFEDVNITDLNLTGPNIPEFIGMGDNLTIAASVEEWNADTCILFLDPVSTEVRQPSAG